MARLAKLGMVVNEEDERRFLCGFRDWTPKCLQRFAHIRWFIPFISLFALVQGMMVNGFVNASVPHLEREFGYTSTESGILLASNDLTGFLFVLFVSYYGEKGHKPLWLGIGSIVLGIGAFLFSIPKFMVGDYLPHQSSSAINFKKYDLCLQNASSTIVELGKHSCSDGSTQSSGLYLAVLCLANMLMGIGATPLNTLGAAYLDENVSPKNSPLYIGVWYGMLILGPSVGFSIASAFLGEYTNLGEVPEGMNQQNPLWVGRWWLPFLTLSWILVFNGFMLMLFPKQMPGALKIREKAIKKGEIAEESKELEEIRKKGFVGFLKATLILVKNKYLMVILLASSAKLFIASGISPFFPKYLTLKFGAEPSKANALLGLVLVSGSIVGLVIGSIIMRSFDVKKSLKKATILCLVIGFLNLGLCFVYNIDGCDSLQLITNTRTIPDGLLKNLTCNNNCGCVKEHYNPVCVDGITYMSPCVAGCPTVVNISNYVGCGCAISRNLTTMNSLGQNTTHVAKEVTKGRCSQNCENLYVFCFCVSLLIMMSFIGVTPKNMITLRSVPANQRSFAMGLQFLMVRLLGMLPGPIIVGQIFDSTCSVWKYDACGEKTSCAEYELDSLSYQMMLISLIGNAINFVLFLVAMKLYKDPGESQKLNFDEIGHSNPVPVVDEEENNNFGNNKSVVVVSSDTEL